MKSDGQFSPVDPSGTPESQGQEDAHVCVYAILPAAEIEMPSLSGIDRRGSIYALAGNAVQAVISRVRADQFNQAALEAGLQDPVWVDVHVRAHQQVLDSLVATGQPVIPLRFSTIYRDEAAVRVLLTTYESALTAELDRLPRPAGVGRQTVRVAGAIAGRHPQPPHRSGELGRRCWAPGVAGPGSRDVHRHRVSVAEEVGYDGCRKILRCGSLDCGRESCTPGQPGCGNHHYGLADQRPRHGTECRLSGGGAELG